MAETTPQAKAEKKPNWRCGAPAGNKNAAKPVLALSTRIKDLKRRVRAAIKAVDSRETAPHGSTGSPEGFQKTSSP